MKQEQFRNVYQHIHLSAQQKDRIWKQVQTASDPQHTNQAGNSLLHYPHSASSAHFHSTGLCSKKALLPTRAAVCLGALLLSGMTVFAANELSLTDRLAEAIKTLTQNEKDATKDQEDLYAQYGQVLDSEIELDNGTLRLDAALYDETNLIIPFRYLFHSDVEGYETLTAGADLDQASPQAQAVYRLDMKTFLGQVNFRIAPDSVQANSQYLITDSILSEDGTIIGSLLVNAHEPKFFEPGTVIQLVKTAVADIPGQTEESVGTDDLIQAVESADSENDPVVYAEFTLGTALEQRELTIDSQNTAALKDMGISVDRISLSPLSLCYSGKGTHTRALSASVTIILKDGRIIKRSPNGSGCALSDTNRDNTSFSFFASVLFEEPVLLEDVVEIQIRNHWGSDIHIPVGNNSIG